MSKKKITIIGSNSFLARNYLEYLNINSYDYDLYLYDFADSKLNNNKPTLIDFMDMNSIEKINFEVDSILFFIGKTGTVNGFNEYEDFININEIALLNFLTVYAKNKSKARIIYPSTRLIYKSSEHNLINESSLNELKSIYAVTKYAAEKYFEIYSKIYGINYVILRICTPIGSLLEDKGNYGTFEIFENQAQKNKAIYVYGDGSQRKTFTHISDVCKAIDLLVGKKFLNRNDYNLGGQDLSLIEIAKRIGGKYNARIYFKEWPFINLNVDGGTTIFDSTNFDNEFSMIYQDVL